MLLIWLFFSHWKTLILEPISMPCSVTTSPISMKTCTKGHRWCKNGDAALSSLLFICIQKKVQPDRCRTWLFFSHWKTLILEPIFMPCSVTTSPISMKTCRKGHRWCENGDAALGSAIHLILKKILSLNLFDVYQYPHHRNQK